MLALFLCFVSLQWHYSVCLLFCCFFFFFSNFFFLHVFFFSYFFFFFTFVDIISFSILAPGEEKQTTVRANLGHSSRL
ncbi:uncharacterized protein BO87DRAFT_49350 [Aspergillus neoniger CBS 115656]|uniref:Uncharacterized protein n=1 Tax=Aspergillus neoniger (strain CBS 115656) TaxID=1448310 RepID=A0A318YP56_ASPNB|nr:hypothetical protein BO87DRAFT_49350 [Aspergillus neoniger CBS 115656]PYH34523.1 hypothetical protein BO87DRAFT_49350 [Aspergillus neoniger CBS 115656]